jgi:hypothetical protein
MVKSQRANVLDDMGGNQETASCSVTPGSAACSAFPCISSTRFKKVLQGQPNCQELAPRIPTHRGSTPRGGRDWPESYIRSSQATITCSLSHFVPPSLSPPRPSASPPVSRERTCKPSGPPGSTFPSRDATHSRSFLGAFFWC